MQLRQPDPAPFPQARSWGAIHTKPRCEKVVAQFLATRQVPVFLPLLVRRRSYGARRRASALPMFPGYLFYDSAAIDRRQLFDSRRVAEILLPEDPRELERDLKSLAGVLAARQSPLACAIGPPGTRVEVVEGPLAGVHGELVRAGGRCSLVLKVHFLGFAAELTVTEEHVRPLP
ncbi:MAG: transcription termination/antitermination NusG family protein [Planctomycetaceae bacterium]